MATDQTGHQSAAAAIAELINASMGIWKHCLKDFDPKAKASDEDLLYRIVKNWQAQWATLFEAVNETYGIGGAPDTPFVFMRDSEASLAFQDAFVDLLNLLARPVKEKFHEFSNTKEDDAPLISHMDSEHLYQKWMAELEEKYAQLFASDVFAKSLQAVIHAAGDASQARKNWLQDALKTTSMPTKEDYDELLKAFHELKRQFRNLSRRVNDSADSAD
jgi:hypothetical protein